MKIEVPLEKLFIGSQKFVYKLVFVVGTNRAGKSLLCRFLNSTGSYEWIHEPYSLQQSIIAYDLCGDRDKNLYKNIAIGTLGENINDRILLRNANFRFGEVTSIYDHLSSDDIFFRLHTLRSRVDVAEYINKRNIIFIVDLPNLLWHLSAVKKIFPDAYIVHVVRNGDAVAYDIARKGWYTSEQIKKDGLGSDLCYYFDGLKLPWWLPTKYRKLFIDGSEELRSYLYWIISMQYLEETYVNETIKYEDFVNKGVDCFNKTSIFSDINLTPKSYEVLEKIRIFNMPQDTEMMIKDYGCPSDVITTFDSMMRRYGYE